MKGKGNQALKLQAAIFDLDGTLIEFEREYFVNETQRIFKLLGCGSFEAAEIAIAWRQDRLVELVNPTKRAAVKEKFWDHFSFDNTPEPRAIAGAEVTLENYARAGISLAIVTARPTTEAFLRRILLPTGLLRWIEIVSAAETEEQRAADKTGRFLDVCRHFMADPSQTLCAGDSAEDMLAATKAQLGARVGVLSGSGVLEELKDAGATLILGSVAELVAAPLRILMEQGINHRAHRD